jgi:probable rRNA maturation factor
MDKSMKRQQHTDNIFIANAHPTLVVNMNRLRSMVARVMNEEGRRGEKVNIILATDGDLMDMNSRYLGRARPTDVLAFRMDRDEHQVLQDLIMGEIYISLDRAHQQAREYQVAFAGEIARLVIHGLLHLYGYDHEDDDDARLMKAKEEEFLEACR